MGFAYRGGSATNPIFINDGARAIQLANLLPPGFQLDVANNSPAVQKYINPVIPVDPNSVANPHQAFYNQNPGAGINNGPGKNDLRGNQRIRN